MFQYQTFNGKKQKKNQLIICLFISLLIFENVAEMALQEIVQST